MGSKDIPEHPAHQCYGGRLKSQIYGLQEREQSPHGSVQETPTLPDRLVI